MAIPTTVRKTMDRDGLTRDNIEQEIRGTRKVRMNIEDEAGQENPQTDEELDGDEGQEGAEGDSGPQGEEQREDRPDGGDEETPARQRTVRNRYDADEEEDGEDGDGVQDKEMTPAEVRALTARLLAERQNERQNERQPQPQGEQPQGEQPQARQRAVLLPSERSAIGNDAVADVIQNVLSRILDHNDQRFQQLQVQNRTVEENLTSTRTNSFRADIERSVEGYAEIIGSRAWQKYLREWNPYAGKPVAEALMDADRRFDKRAVLGIFEGFTSRFEKPDAAKAGGNGKRRSLTDIAAPSKSGASGAPSGGAKKYDFKESDAVKWDQQRRSKKMSMGDYQKKVDAYEKAMARGRVEMGV